VGLNRPTRNFDRAQIDDSFKIKDIEALHMAHYLIENEGIFVGGSCALNLCAVVKYCRNKKGSRVVTILHDSGNRYLRKFYDSKYLKEKNIQFDKK
jgi:cysteine synthase A